MDERQQKSEAAGPSQEPAKRSFNSAVASTSADESYEDVSSWVREVLKSLLATNIDTTGTEIAVSAIWHKSVRLDPT